MINSKINKDKYIWYVCYGSNMLLERLLCYFTGQESKKYNIKPLKPFNNPNPPLKSLNVELPFDVYFAYNSSRWDGCGVAFLNTSKPGKSFGRAYLIEKNQLEELHRAEGKGLYDLIYKLDDIEGLEAYTITSSVVHPYVKPSDRYVQVIKDGLYEMGLNSEKIESYLIYIFSKMKSSNEHILDKVLTHTNSSSQKSTGRSKVNFFTVVENGKQKDIISFSTDSKADKNEH